jgi:hypothetical protein
MAISAFQALRGAKHSAATSQAPTLLVAGATGALGNAMLRRLLGTQRYGHAHVLAREPISMGMRSVQIVHMPTDVANWPLLYADTAVVMFDPPRMYYERERALFTPEPEQLPALAVWLKACGVRSLAIATAHAQGSLPEALKRGLANLDEQAVASLGFERLLIVRSAQRPAASSHTSAPRPAPQALAHWMLGALQFMVPSSEQPVRPAKIAEFVDIALQSLPKGSFVAAPELLWQASQGDTRTVVAQWTANLPH